ncbi:hypothetical protein AB0E08_48435 [Streptomyces sp. NPDC048281]|uniref:hypothetical protein n=1 Tax=Streptomyces sp. NPDC048281 TaxID=3154715 RepID=UPI0034310995
MDVVGQAGRKRLTAPTEDVGEDARLRRHHLGPLPPGDGVGRVKSEVVPGDLDMSLFGSPLLHEGRSSTRPSSLRSSATSLF